MRIRLNFPIRDNIQTLSVTHDASNYYALVSSFGPKPFPIHVSRVFRRRTFGHPSVFVKGDSFKTLKGAIIYAVSDINRKAELGL